MSLIYITGISGSGKSTVRHKLVERGYDAWDVDEDGFKSWFNKTTDTPAREQKRWRETSVEWRQLYWLKIDRSKVEALARTALQSERPTFLCGVTPNDNDIWDLFDQVIHLAVSNDVLRKRLAARTGNDYGKHPDDLADILRWNEKAADDNRRFGAVVLNAERTVEEVVDHVLATACDSCSQAERS